MCQKQKDSDCPKGKDPRECTPEQIAECHPEGSHCCEQKSGKKSDKRVEA